MARVRSLLILNADHLRNDAVVGEGKDAPQNVWLAGCAASIGGGVARPVRRSR
jgi:hypothetical protein